MTDARDISSPYVTAKATELREEAVCIRFTSKYPASDDANFRAFHHRIRSGSDSVLKDVVNGMLHVFAAGCRRLLQVLDRPANLLTLHMSQRLRE